MFVSDWRLFALAGFICPPWAMYVQAVEGWEQTYEQGIWNVEKSPFQCVMSQKINGIAEARIIRQPEINSLLELVLSYPEAKITAANVTLYRADWKTIDNSNVIPLAYGYLSDNKAVFSDVGNPVLTALTKGDWLQFTVELDGRPQSFLFTTTHGNEAVNKFRQCLATMSPLSWESARERNFYFANGQRVINSAEDIQKLKDIVTFIKIDKHVNKVLVDGYTDNVGDRIANRQLSKERADEIAARLVEFGLKPAQLEVRAHGSRYPIISNNDKDEGINRRVSVRLIRKGNDVVK